MTSRIKNVLMAATAAALVPAFAIAGDTVSDKVISDQRAALATSTDGAGFGPQSPRDIDTIAGTNKRSYNQLSAR